MTRSSRTPVPPVPSPDGNGSKLPAKPDPRRLHEATDRLNKVLLDFEDVLVQLKLGVSARIVLDENDDGWYKALSFSKLGGQFKLAIETGVEYDPANINTTPITSASRETRLEAVEELPKLYQALLSAFEAEIERVNAGIAAVEQLAEELRPPKARQYPC